MAVPTTRDEFKAYCLRRLGEPTIKINVTEEQVDDRVDEALNKFHKFNFDGSEKTYVAHQVTQSTYDTKTITLGNEVIGVVDVFDMGFTAGGGASMLFNVPYQLLMRTNLNVIGQFINGRFPFRYSEKTNVVHLDCAQSKLAIGSYVVLEAYAKIDPTTHPDVWSDLWLQDYATALIKLQYATNVTKFSGTMLPGGVSVNGEKWKEEATREVAELEKDLYETYSPILMDMVG